MELEKRGKFYTDATYPGTIILSSIYVASKVCTYFFEDALWVSYIDWKNKCHALCPEFPNRGCHCDVCGGEEND